MIKKLNKEREFRERSMWIHYHKEDTSDLSRINYQAWEIYFQLNDLQERMWLHSLRLRHALLYKNSPIKIAELKLQQRIVDEHINQIKQFREENQKFKSDIFEKLLAEDDLENIE
jgi:hypothetical protein|tara:strand:- start:316 stop:660 length:345 start_codon:yes stop_codon:yes gene_type:complete